MTNNIPAIKNFLLDLQNRLCVALENQDASKKFYKDKWTKNKIDGLSCILENGNILEKAGVNFSSVIGDSLPPAATTKNPDLLGASFGAMGVSSVIHPKNPFVPTAHLNVRYFQAKKTDGEIIWWFGGGFDLTPYYGFEEDCIHWHKTAKNFCDKSDKNFYPRFKKAADDYFFIKHRNEHRGIGGLFFDDLNELSFEKCFAFLKNVGNGFIDAYIPIIEKRKSHAFNDAHKSFQHYRRGRYVEFNLVEDRGTLFGLQMKGRTESILMSLPPQVEWKYNFTPEKNSEEEKLTEYFLKPKDWV